MDRKHDWFSDDSDDIFGPIERFEDMVKSRSRYFFDVHELETIIDFYLETENFSFATKAAKYALGMYPSSTSIQQRISEIMIDKGQPIEALGILKRIGEIEPDNADILILKGDALIMTGKIREARRAYERAYAKADEEEKDELAFHIGVSLEKAEQYHLALRYLQDVLVLNPYNFTAYYDLAFCYDKIGMSDKSIEYYNKYLDEDPFSENVWYNLGFSYGVTGQYEKSLEAYDYAISLNTQYSSALFNKANLQAHLEKYAEAIQTYREFLQLESDNAQAHCYMAECFEKQGDNEMATEYYRQAMALNPDLADAWLGMGMVYFNQQNFKSSIAHILNAIQLEPDNTEFYFALGTVYNSHQRPEKAITAFQKCLEEDPDGLEVLEGMLISYLQLKKRKEARLILNKLAEIEPDNSCQWYREAAYLFLFNQMKKGLEALQKGLTLKPEESEKLFKFYPDAANDPNLAALIRIHSRSSND